MFYPRSKPMVDNSEKIAKAKEVLFMNTPVDKIYETYADMDYVEFRGSAGGDVCCYRVYDDGKVYAR